MTILLSLPTPRRLVCTGCGIDKPVEAFYRLYRSSRERAQPCKTCEPHPTDTPEEADPETRAAAAAALTLAARTLALCRRYPDLEVAVMTLIDAVDFLTEYSGDGQ